MYAVRTVYTIKQAAARSGLSIPLLRAWERRYHVVEPARTASGYRLYDEAALERLRSMRRLVEAGWTPSNAARAILAGEAVGLPEDVVHPIGGGTGQDDLGGRVGEPRGDGEAVTSFVEAAANLDGLALERALDRMFASGSFESVVEQVLMPALTAVGDEWAAGRLSVAGEHAASHSVLRRLAASYQAAGRAAPRDRVILVGMPPGVRHELGAMAFGTAARRAGLPILYLGADLPIDDWVTTARGTRARAAVVGVLSAADIRPAVEVARSLRTTMPDLLVAFGGRNASRAAELLAGSLVPPPDEATGAPIPSGGGGSTHWPLVLPEPVQAAVEALEDALATRS